MVTKKFEPMKPGDYYYKTMSIIKGIDGTYYLSYGSGEIKLTPDELNAYKGPGGWVIQGESATSLVMYDSYMGNIRYKKVK
jgi:hypothetical protein